MSSMSWPEVRAQPSNICSLYPKNSLFGVIYAFLHGPGASWKKHKIKERNRALWSDIHVFQPNSLGSNPKAAL